MSLSFALLAAIKVGIIGLDTSHTLAFTKIMNVDKPAFAQDFQVTAAYQWGSRDIFSSTNRYPAYTAEMKKMGVRIVPTIDELLKEVDCVCLETNDGREHLWQAKKVFASGKRVFIDKPLAADLKDSAAIVREAERTGASFFSASCLRFGKVAAAARRGEYGPVRGAFTMTPEEFEPTHSDYYWYAIHGAEHLYAFMGRGCENVTTVATADGDMMVGRWKDGRIGSVLALQAAQYEIGFRGTVTLARKTDSIIDAGTNEGYLPLLKEVLQFFKTGVAPVSPKETLEVMAFLEAARVSRARGGKTVWIAEVLEACEDR